MGIPRLCSKVLEKPVAEEPFPKNQYTAIEQIAKSLLPGYIYTVPCSL